MRAVINNSGRVLVGNLTVADSIFSRMKGLLGKKELSQGEGLWIRPCKGVHTFGMKFAIDVIILNRQQCVIAIKHELKPNRMTTIYPGAATVLELPVASARDAQLSVGDVINFVA
jgi:uncharacterized membrane protein (UPF0127 family)